MKSLRILSLVITALCSSVYAADFVASYSDFGPQATAHDLIGMEWWQWDTHGDNRPREYPIKVIVYWNQSLEETKKRFTVDRGRELDFRYVSYSLAIQYLENTIKELQESGLSTARLQQTLNRIRKAHQ